MSNYPPSVISKESGVAIKMHLLDGQFKGISCQNSGEQVRQQVPILLIPISCKITGCYGEESLPKYQLELLVTSQDWIIIVIYY